MGYIDGFEDIMAMETGFLQYTMKLLAKDYQKELDMLGITLPDVSKIPAVRFDKAKRDGCREIQPYDPQSIRLGAGRRASDRELFKEDYGADFVFMPHIIRAKKRPFYAMDDPRDAKIYLKF